MSGNTRIPKAQITGPYGYLLKQFSRRLFGAVPEPAEVMWHNRAVLSSMEEGLVVCGPAQVRARLRCVPAGA